MDKYNYEKEQISRLLPVDQYGIQVKLKSSSGETKWLTLNKNIIESIQEIHKQELPEQVCAFCSSKAKAGMGYEYGKVTCSNDNCPVSKVFFTYEQWIIGRNDTGKSIENDYGWDCPKSPDKKCHYYSVEMGGKRVVELKNGFHTLPKDYCHEYETDDDCIFCHEPEERK